MIGLVEGASRQKTPNEIALHILLVGLTLIFLFACVTLVPIAAHSGIRLSVTAVVALLVCLIPTTIGGLLSAIGIAGMDRLLRKNVLAMSGRAVEAAGDVDVLLLDKTGTITLGNRMAADFVPAAGVRVEDLAEAAQLASLADETPEGRSIVVLAKERFALRGRDLEGQARFVPFTAQTRMSGCDFGDRVIRKGAVDAAARHVACLGGGLPEELSAAAGRIGDSGGTPLAVSDGARVLGIVELKDVVKGGIAERFERFRAMGIRTVMITGDNPRTAAAIAREAGVDDFLAEATPEAKMRRIQDEQAKGKLVAMTGDGTNDAPALAQADVGVAMNTGTQAAKEAGNMVDLDSNPTKLLEVVEVGKQLLMTRGTLTTFSIANDVAKYFAILPALFVGGLPRDGCRSTSCSSPRRTAPSSPRSSSTRSSSWRSSRWRSAACATARSGPRRSCVVPCSSTAWAASWPRSSGSSSSTWRSPRSAPPEERPCSSRRRPRSASPPSPSSSPAFSIHSP